MVVAIFITHKITISKVYIVYIKIEPINIQMPASIVKRNPLTW